MPSVAPEPSRSRPSEPKPKARRSRKDPDERRADLVRAARLLFSRSGYADLGLEEIAAEAHVSKALLYHYFPGGRPDVFGAVVEQLVADLDGLVRSATASAVPPTDRLRHVIGTVIGYFAEDPDAYRLLFRDAGATRDPAVEAMSATLRARLAAELAGLMAGSGLGPAEVTAASVGLLGFLLANVDLMLDEQIDAETAFRVTTGYASAHVAP
jgi:AcrR family transcriptional regulator